MSAAITFYLNKAKAESGVESFKGLYQKINEDDLQFSYAPVTYQEFQSVYRPNGWVARKVGWVIEIPLHLITAIATLAAAALCLLVQSEPKATACLFSAIRLCEASTGYLICVFNDRIGKYLITDADMHIKFYTSHGDSEEEFVEYWSNAIPVRV